LINNFLVRSYFNYGGYLFRLFPGLMSFLLPRTLVVEASNMCMLKCPACATIRPSYKRQRGVMPFATFKLLIDQIDWKVNRINFSYSGEPLVNPDIFKMVKYAGERGISTIIETNGMLLDDRIHDLLESGLTKLNIAFDGVSQDVISKYRVGLDYNKSINGIRRLIREKAERHIGLPEVHLQFIVMKHNQDYMQEAIDLANSLGADFIDFKSMILSGGSGLSKETKEALASKYLPDSDKFSRYERGRNGWRLKKGRQGFCNHPLSDAVIMLNGDVTVCTMDVDGNLSVGNIFKAPLRKIWKSKQYAKRRRDILFRDLAECKECCLLPSDFKTVRTNTGFK